jgi:hypothetical protein
MEDPASLRAFAAKCREMARMAPPRLSDELLQWAEGAELRAAGLDRGEGGPSIAEPC